MAELSRLPNTTLDEYDWQFEGACREADPTLFFHPEGERGPARVKRDVAAKAVCAGCPVIQQCRQHGLSVQEPFGVWGGLTEEDREYIYRRSAAQRSGATELAELAELAGLAGLAGLPKAL